LQKALNYHLEDQRFKLSKHYSQIADRLASDRRFPREQRDPA